jgi:outer membrane protein OmpA-like peptidoglycan-associated protein
VDGAGATRDPVAEAIRRDQAARSAGAAAGGESAGAGAAGGRPGTAGAAAKDGAAKDGAANVAGGNGSGRSGAASGSSHKSGSDPLAADDDDAAAGGDPVKRALRQAEKTRQAAAASGGAGAGAGAGGAGGTGAAGSATANSAGAGAGGAAGHADDSPVARALRQAEAAEAAARERERLEAEARRGRVETAANSVLIDQDDRLQTLGGMLPMALNMDEQGLFDFDRYQLRDEVKKSLDEVAEKLKTAAYDKLHILGFTDRIGTEEYNRRLSEKRAWAVAGYLMNKGVPPHKLRVVGRGEEGSVVGDEQCEGLTREAMIECLQRDRRVEIAATVKEYQLEVR